MVPGHNGRMGYSEVVSTLALVLALFLAVRTWHQDRPVISVKGEQWPGGVGTAEAARISFKVEVLNTGNQATEVLAAFWQIERDNLPDEEMPASHGGNGFEALFETPDRQPEPTFPFTLDRHAPKAWAFDVALEGVQNHHAITRMRPAVTIPARKANRTVTGPWVKPNFL